MERLEEAGKDVARISVVSRPSCAVMVIADRPQMGYSFGGRTSVVCLGILLIHTSDRTAYDRGAASSRQAVLPPTPAHLVQPDRYACESDARPSLSVHG
jgi:hypothetical protein